jgi:predicted RNA-binding Zn-ribbon protein involved in translation (DUF1610 family)
MATLIIEEPGRRFGGRITGRVLIGRLPTNGVALTDSSVSRLHAWIDQRDGQDYVADTGSLTGTWVNTQPIEKQKYLLDGDVIRVGQTQITYQRSDVLPEDVPEVNLAGEPPAVNVIDAGVLFDCACGAPIWFKSTAIGHAHQCRHCGRTIRIPEHAGQVAQEIAAVPKTPPPVAVGPLQSADDPMLLHTPDSEQGPHVDEHGLTDVLDLPTAALSELPPLEEIPEPASELTLEQAVSPEAEVPFPGPTMVIDEEEAPPPVKRPLFEPKRPMVARQICSVCHNPITAGETTTVCPSCGLTFHAECWQENQGCSAYGCPQVGVLAPAAEEPVEEEPAVAVEGDDEPQEVSAGFPWEFLFLFAAVIGVLLGIPTYGIPPAIGLLGTFIYLMAMQDSRKRRPVVWLALLIGLIGIGAGLYVSKVWWGGWPPIGPWARHGGGR